MMIDPTWTVGLLSSDMGSVYSSDGREHPITGMTPVYPVSVQTAPDNTTTTPPVQNASFGGVLDTVKGIFDAQHVIARVVVAIVGVGLVFIVALRLTR